MRFLASVLAVLMLVGCAANVGKVTPTVPVSEAVSPAQARATHYVYVIQRSTKSVTISPADVVDPAPIRTVSIPDGPVSIATDSTGRVYVAVWNTYAINVYEPGMTKLLYSIPLPGEPYGIYINAHDDLVVPTVGDAGSYVSEYLRGSKDVYALVSMLNGWAIESAALDDQGNIFAEAYSAPYNFVFEYVNNEWVRLPVSGPGPSSIGFDAKGDLTVDAINSYRTYTPYSWKSNVLMHVTSGDDIGHALLGHNGCMYIPVTKAEHYVLVLPGKNARDPYKIIKGMVDPVAAAEG